MVMVNIHALDECPQHEQQEDEMTQHNKTPWTIVEYGDNLINIRDADDKVVMALQGADRKIKAAHIVKAVNSHESMVEALEGVLQSAINWASTIEDVEGKNNVAWVRVRAAQAALKTAKGDA